MGVAVDPDDVVGLAIEREGDLLHAGEIDRAEPLEDGPSPPLPFAVSAADRHQRGEHFVVLTPEPLGAGDPHALGEQANARRRHGPLG